MKENKKTYNNDDTLRGKVSQLIELLKKLDKTNDANFAMHIDVLESFIGKLREGVRIPNVANIDYNMVYFGNLYSILSEIRYVFGTYADHRNIAYDCVNHSNKDIYQKILVLSCDIENYIPMSVRSGKSHKNRIYNSETYYNEEIEKIEARVKLVERERRNLDEKLLMYEKDSLNKSVEIEQAKEERNNISNELIEDNALINQYKLDADERKKRDDAITVWTSKITGVFENLKAHLKTIEDEYAVLKGMFYTYNILAAIIVALLVIIEYCIYCKIQYMNPPTFYGYISLIAPLPIMLGLLWGFITQANRAQLQRVALAKQIHGIKYTEGLLLAINNLSIDLTDSARRINEAIDKLLNKHLSGNTGAKEWKECMNQDQQFIPYNNLVKILKEIRGITKE